MPFYLESEGLEEFWPDWPGVMARMHDLFNKEHRAFYVEWVL
jgi:hypothetical protein